MANTEAIPRYLKLGGIRSPLGNDAIEISNTGAVSFPGSVTFPGTISLDANAGFNIGNTTVNAQISSVSVTVQNGTSNSTITSLGISIVTDSGGLISVGNSSVNTVIDNVTVSAKTIQQANSMFVANSLGVYVNSSVNATGFSVATDITIDSTGLNTTKTVNANSFSIGTNFTANTTKLSHIGIINAGSFSMGSVFVSNTSELRHTSNTFTLGTSTVQANNGFTKLPNGLLMQWGRSVANDTAGDITFPVAFSSLYNVQLTANGNYTAWHSGLSTTAVNIRASSNLASVDVHWVAIGV